MIYNPTVNVTAGWSVVLSLEHIDLVAWVTYLRKLWAKSGTFDAETSMPVLPVLRQKYLLPENRHDQILIGFFSNAIFA